MDRDSPHSGQAVRSASQPTPVAIAGGRAHAAEPHRGRASATLNALRAAVLGANDGIVSVAGIVVGVAGATTMRGPIFTAGLAAIVAGAIAMALGEFVSVSSQRDTERALLIAESHELVQMPDAELAELAAIYQRRGLSAHTAAQVARELTEHDALTAHAHAELNIDPDALANPWQAAAASAVSFACGGLLPLCAVLVPPAGWRVPITVAAVLGALAVAGALSARVGQAGVGRAMLRVVLGGAVGLGLTYGVGHLFGTAVH